MLKPLVVLVGPTAIGKSELGIHIAKKIAGEIISGDSMQVYKEMDIGTAKITRSEMQGVPHHMLDILKLDEDFNVAIFKDMVEAKIAEIQQRGKIPIIVGGTGLYIRSIIDPYDFTPVPVDWEYRNYLQQIADEKGNQYIHQMLTEVDPKTASKLHPNDQRRVIRALEVFHFAKKPISEYQVVADSFSAKYNLAMFGLNMEREKLYQRINLRVDKMIAEGLVAEILSLLEKGYHKDLIAMQGLGYKEIINYLNGEYNLEQAIYLIKRNTRHFAKRQLTWFRRDNRIKWFNVENYQSLTEIAMEINQIIEGQLFFHVE